MDVERRRQTGCGRLGKHARDIVERRDPVETEMPPARVHGGVDDPGKVGFLFLIGNVRTIPAHLTPHQRVTIGADRLGIRRDVDTRSVASHVVVVDICLWLPLAEQDFPNILRLHNISLEGVAIVVVADVLVIEPGQIRTFVLGVERLAVPVSDHDLPVRIERRHDQRNHVIEHTLGLFVPAREQIVGQFWRHLAAANLGGVHAHRLTDHHLALGDQRFDLGLAEPAWVGELRADFPEAVELADVFRRGNNCQQERMPHCGGTHVDELHLPAALFFKKLVILDDLVPARHLAVAAQLEREKLLRWGYFLSLSRRTRRSNQYSDRQHESYLSR